MRLLVITALYFVAGKLGLSFATVHSSASAVWPGTGIALSAFLLFGYRVWPAIFVAAFLVNITTAGNVFTSLGIAAGNTLEGVAGAWLVARFAGGAACFERARDVFKFAALAGAVATVISATIGVTSLSLAGFAKWQDFHEIWVTWWLGDAAGALIVTPLILLWYSKPMPEIPHHRGEVAFLMAVVIVVATAVFAVPVIRDYPLSFLCLPPLAWIAFRFGPRETATSIVLLTVIAVVTTESNLGPFVMPTRNESLLVLQTFMGMVAITLMPMAALVREVRLAVGEAEAATRARDVFLAMLSHELRNPLQAIVASLALVPRARSTEEAKRAVDIAQRQSDHLSHLLNDLLDVARAVSGKVTVNLQPVRLDEVARHCADLLHGTERLGTRDLRVEADPLIVNADTGRLEQIIGNLLSNSIKFTPPDGRIVVSVKAEGGQGVLRVTDNGAGIAPELLPRVFDLFMQGERTIHRREGGLGLGLSLVKTFAELQGGNAEVRSAGPGQGTEVTVRFLLGRLPDDAPRSAPQTTPQAPKYRVLIVEDNDDAREALRLALEAMDYEVHEASDGVAGVEAAERVRPNIVLVDIGLPEIDGYEVARRLRARQLSLGIRWRLIALTGYGQPDDIRRAIEAGFDSHVVKPVHPLALQDAMSKAVIPA